MTQNVSIFISPLSMPRILTSSEKECAESAQRRAYIKNQSLPLNCWNALLGLPFQAPDQNQLDRTLHDAARFIRHSSLELESYICAGANPNAPLAKHGSNALMSAAYGEWQAGPLHVSAIALLLNYCDPKDANLRGMTALMMAVTNNISEKTWSEPAIQKFVSRSDPNARDHEGRTALSIAISNGQLEWVQGLVPKTNLSGCDNKGQTYLMQLMTSEHSCHDEYKKLLLPGCNPNEWNADGELALSMAARRGDQDWVSTLLPLTDLWATNAQGESALNGSLKAAESHPGIAELIATFAAQQQRHQIAQSVLIQTSSGANGSRIRI